MKTDANVLNAVTVAAETLLPLEGAGLTQEVPFPSSLRPAGLYFLSDFITS